MTSLLFYTTAGCHLCEQAEQMLQQIQREQDVQWQSVDIATDANLVELYGIRIPVLKRPDSDSELGWPFDYSTLSEFLSTTKVSPSV